MNCLLYYPEYQWSTNYTIEQTFLCLIKIKEKDSITCKYEKRLRWLMRRFNIWAASQPIVIIYRKDLSKRIYKELVKLKEESPTTLDYIITRTLEMVFECIEEADEPVFNGEYYLLSVKRYNRLQWRFDRKEDQITDPDSKYDIPYPLYNSNGIVVDTMMVT